MEHISAAHTGVNRGVTHNGRGKNDYNDKMDVDDVNLSKLIFCVDKDSMYMGLH